MLANAALNKFKKTFDYFWSIGRAEPKVSDRLSVSNILDLESLYLFTFSSLSFVTTLFLSQRTKITDVYKQVPIAKKRSVIVSQKQKNLSFANECLYLLYMFI